MTAKLTIANMKKSNPMTGQPSPEVVEPFTAIQYTLIDLNSVMTAEAIVIEYGATVEDVYRAVTGQQIKAVHSGNTWIVRREDAARRWLTQGAGRSVMLTLIAFALTALMVVVL